MATRKLPMDVATRLPFTANILYCDKRPKLERCSVTDLVANAVDSGVSCHKLLAAQTVFSRTWLLRLAPGLSANHTQPCKGQGEAITTRKHSLVEKRRRSIRLMLLFQMKKLSLGQLAA
jgi:hypothetical protein